MSLGLSLGTVHQSLNESPSEKEGKFLWVLALVVVLVALNESPSEKEGKFYEWSCL